MGPAATKVRPSSDGERDVAIRLLELMASHVESELLPVDPKAKKAPPPEEPEESDEDEDEDESDEEDEAWNRTPFVGPTEDDGEVD